MSKNSTRQAGGWRQHLVAEAGFNVSWGSIFAGVVTFLATLVTLSLIGSAIGFGMFEPTSGSPFQGVGTGVMVWTVINLVLSFLAGGFVAGMAARRVGMIHGFLTWATNVLVLVIMLSVLSVQVLSGVGSLLGGALNLVGEGASAVASGAEEVITNITEDLNVDTGELDAQIQDVLEDTDTPELQPEYISGQMEEARNEILAAGRELVVNPENSDQIFDSLTNSLEQRVETITNAADRDAIAEAVESNTDLSPAEAEEATDNIYNGMQDAASNAEQALNQASQSLQEVRQNVQQAAEEAANTARNASIWSFVGLILGMILSTIAGIWGSNFVGKRQEEVM